ncbi:MAG TPA: hypothetical protein ENN19_17685 [Chloroflexi bacterium]|nr:hypothetical protein [Chloroflexota bacterium]
MRVSHGAPVGLQPADGQAWAWSNLIRLDTLTRTVMLEATAASLVARELGPIIRVNVGDRQWVSGRCPRRD